jgi:predicted metalloendopeptidase
MSLRVLLSDNYHKFDDCLNWKTSEVVTYLRQEFDEILDKNNWMDSETKGEAIRKSRSMKIVIGYPEHLKNDSLVNEHYRTVCSWFQFNKSYLE